MELFNGPVDLLGATIYDVKSWSPTISPEKKRTRGRKKERREEGKKEKAKGS